MSETWRPVVGYEGFYEVSDEGRVRSVPRVVHDALGRVRRLQAVMISPTNSKYRQVRLKRSDGGRTKYVHALVAEAFIGPRPDGMEICHNNGQKHDNRAVNLRYDTHSNNQRDMLLHGTHNEARRTHCSQGHEFTPENTYRRGERGRRCATCQADRAKRRRLNRAAA